MKKTILFALVLTLVLIASVVNADFTFGTLTNLGPPVNSSYGDGSPSISADGLSLFFQSTRPGGYGKNDIWATKRASVSNPWGPPVNLGPIVNSSSSDWDPCISADGLELYFMSNRPGGLSGWQDIWMTRRASKDDPWTTPVNLGPPVNSSATDGNPSISADGLSLYHGSWRGGYGKTDLWVTTRATTNDPWRPPVNLGPIVNSSSVDSGPSISTDGLSLFFNSDRLGGYGKTDLWVTTRATTNDPWRPPVNLGPTVNTSSVEWGPGISPDGSTLYFGSQRSGGLGGLDIWQAPIIPNVDFNGDFKIVIKDLIILIEHWGRNEPAYDMGPMPWGDGIIDAADLEVLMSYWEQEVSNPSFIVNWKLAHWKLDETEGDIAYDSAGTHDAVAVGDPLWQPDGGRVDGALLFDGVDDGLIADRVLNPSDGPFSVFAWIKGGAPGQVILSQGNGTDWLMANVDQGALRTNVSDPVKSVRGGTLGGLPLISQASIIDGNWHRIGFVWNGANRILYVDDIEVARDTLNNLASIRGDLYIGAGKDLAADTFWSGLIDDVRIYSRVVAP